MRKKKKLNKKNRRQHEDSQWSASARQTFLTPFSASTTTDDKPINQQCLQTQEATNARSDSFCRIKVYCNSQLSAAKGFSLFGSGSDRSICDNDFSAVAAVS